jgi:hypothetical protein
METVRELVQAGLGEFWGFNPKLLANLHRKYGKVVKFWLGGLYVSYQDCDDCKKMMVKACGRPPLIYPLLSFLGKRNLLFLPTDSLESIHTMKTLRSKYSKLVQSKTQLRLIHEEARNGIAKVELLKNPIDAWSVFGDVMYDVLGTFLFRKPLSATESGATLISLHRFLIEKSATLGLRAFEEFSLRNLLRMPIDGLRYHQAVSEFHSILAKMIQEKRIEIEQAKHEEVDDSDEPEEAEMRKVMTEADMRRALTRIVEDENGAFFDEDMGVAFCAGILHGA